MTGGGGGEGKKKIYSRERGREGGKREGHEGSRPSSSDYLHFYLDGSLRREIRGFRHERGK